MLQELQFEFEAITNKKGNIFLLQNETKIEDYSSDESKLYQCLWSLLSNAHKFTKAGKVTLQVQISESTPQMLIFSVQDTGIGISQEQLGTIFDKFTQADPSSTRKYEGSGLGLALSRDLVESLEGTISVTSQVAQGSTFTIELPLVSQLARGK